jgi:phosphoribosylformimino-5-aminoimidazole carboxamide ribotide isomerase
LKMIVIPAIDIREGRCVRLFQGKYDEVTDYGDNPVGVARECEARGAKRIHVVDLDRAVKDSAGNFDIIKNICRSVAIPVECGGGVRTIQAAYDLIDAGVTEIIMGTVVIKDPDLTDKIIQSVGSDKVQIGFDFSGRKIAVKGWKELVEGSVVDEINQWHGRGVQRFIVTDINRDGTMEGPNIEAFRSIAEQTDVKITASGGVSKPEDIHQLRLLESSGVDRTISGKAIYEGTIMIEDFV